jgi:hypothetical protein
MGLLRVPANAQFTLLIELYPDFVNNNLVNENVFGKWSHHNSNDEATPGLRTQTESSLGRSRFSVQLFALGDLVGWVSERHSRF